jgi:hypothetical protein
MSIASLRALFVMFSKKTLMHSMPTGERCTPIFKYFEYNLTFFLSLEQVTGSQLSSWLQPPQGKLLSSSFTSACSKPAVVSIPMLEERVRLVQL